MWTTVFSRLPVLTSWGKWENDMGVLTLYNPQETTTECVDGIRDHWQTNHIIL